MLETDSGYGRFIGLSAFPSSFVIYGIVVMFTLNREVTPENSGALFGIGLFAGLAFLYAGIWQGRACAAAINASPNVRECATAVGDPAFDCRPATRLRLRQTGTSKASERANCAATHCWSLRCTPARSISLPA